MKKNKIAKIFTNLYPFLIIIFIYTIILQTNFVYGHVVPSYIFSILRYLIVLICGLKIILIDIKDYNIKKIYILFILFVILVISAYYTGSRNLFQLYFLILSSRNIDIKKVMKKTSIAIFSLMMIIMLLAILKIIPNYTISRNDSDTVRYALGFNYCTFPAIMILSLSLVYVFIKEESLNNTDILLVFTINLIMYILTNTRMELLCAILLLLMLLLYKKYNNKLFFNQILGKICKCSLIILSTLSIILALTYTKDNTFMYRINTISSNRLELWNRVSENYKIKLLGNKIEYYDITKNNKNAFIIDNSYLDVLYSNGLILYLIILYLFYSLINYSINQKKYYLQIILFIIFIHSFINPDLMMIKYNLFLLLLPLPFIKKTDNESHNNNGITIEEIHNVQSKMLKEFKKFCENNNLRYYLCGGTLLGAIRHKGFIPWDDDIDVLMPRPDYEKLIEITENNKVIAPKIYLASYKNSKESMPFIKLFNEEYRVEEKYIKFENGQFLWLDIFPMDGLSDNDNDNAKLYKEIKILRDILTLRLLDENKIYSSSTTKLKAIFKPLVKCVIDIIPVKYFLMLIDKKSQKYNFNNSKYVGGVMWGYGLQEKMLKKKVLKTVKVDFEGEKYDTFSCYDEYLHNLYNDYMKLPPVEERSTHISKIVKVGIHEKKNNN